MKTIEFAGTYRFSPFQGMWRAFNLSGELGVFYTELDAEKHSKSK